MTMENRSSVKGNRGDGHDGKKPWGKFTEPRGDEKVLKIVGTSPLAKEFISPGETFREALARCVIKDANEKKAIILYKAQLTRCGLWEEIEDLTDLLIASGSEGGFNRSLAAMVGTNIYVPEGAGIKMSKDSLKALESYNQVRHQRRQDRDNGDEGEKS